MTATYNVLGRLPRPNKIYYMLRKMDESLLAYQYVLSSSFKNIIMFYNIILLFLWSILIKIFIFYFFSNDFLSNQ